MEELGALLSVLARPRDVILLDGDLGAGKTTFSRGFIQCKMNFVDDGDIDDDSGDNDNEADYGGGSDDDQMGRTLSSKNDIFRVTSPTYLLSNTYVYRYDDNGDENNDVFMDRE